MPVPFSLSPFPHVPFSSFVADASSNSRLSTSWATCVGAHELGHNLTYPQSNDEGPTGPNSDNDPAAGNHYAGVSYFRNLMKASAGDPAPGSVFGAKRLWNDPVHTYVEIPITNQIDFMRMSPLLK